MTPVEYHKILWWLLGIVSAIAGAFGIRYFNRQENDVEYNGEKIDNLIQRTNEAMIELNMRVAALERNNVTIEFLKNEIDSITELFRADHTNIVTDYRKLAESMVNEITRSEERTKETVAQFSHALRREMSLIQDNIKTGLQRQESLLDRLLGLISEKRDHRRDGE